MTRSASPPREVHPADPGLRRAFLLTAVLLALAGVAAVLVLDSYLQALQAFAESFPEAAAHRFLLTARFFFALPAVVMVGLALHIGWRSWHGLRGGRLPPEGARLLRAAPVLRGDEARRRATFRLWLALLLLVAGILAPWQGYRYFVERFRAEVEKGGEASQSSAGARPRVPSVSARA